MERTARPSDQEFWMSSKKITVSKMEETAIEHTYEAIEIVANAHEAHCFEKSSFEKFFPALYRECYILRIVKLWDEIKPMTEEEKEKERAEIAKQKEEAEAIKDGEDEDLDFSFSVFPTEENPLTLEFIEIMKTRPDLISEEQKFRAFEIFPLVIWELGEI